MINPSSQDQNYSDVSRSCVCVCMCVGRGEGGAGDTHHHHHLQGRDVSKRETSIGSWSDQSVSAEELQSGTAGLGFQSWESDFGTYTKRTVISTLKHPPCFFLHVCPLIPSTEKQ